MEKKPLRFYERWPFLIVVCVTLAVSLRSCLYTPFHIPSGSMKSTLLVGDYIIASKFAYGYSRFSFPFSPNLFQGRIFEKEPKRGDVIVFRLPSNPSVDYIKRLIGLPGDVIQVKHGVLYINSKPVSRKRIEDYEEEEEDDLFLIYDRYIETLPEGVSYEVLDQYQDSALDNTAPYVVPSHHYFFMGDNRDNSQDSRVLEKVGFVPAENLVGRAEVVVLSNPTPFWKLWEWPFYLRTDRFWRIINP